MKHITLIILSLFIGTAAQAILPDRKYVRLPQDVGLVYKKLDVVTKDGFCINTWFFPAQDIPADNAAQQGMIPYRTLDGTRRPTLIICNADAGNMSYTQLSLVPLYTANGYNVVTFDWRGFGESSAFTMDPDYLCYTGMLEDYKAVINATCREKTVDRRLLYLMGWSTGAYLSMIAAHDSNKVKGCILSGTPSSFEDIIPHLVKVHPKGKTAANLLVPDDFPKEQMPAHLAPEFKKDILLIVGSKDARTPQWMSEKIYDALPDGIYKRLSVYEGAGHGGRDFPFMHDWSRWADETLEFIHKL